MAQYKWFYLLTYLIANITWTETLTYLEANAVDVDRLRCCHKDADSTQYVQQRSEHAEE